MQESRATIEPVEEDRELVDGDWAQITYTGLIDGEADAAPVAGEDSLVEIGGKDTVEAFTTALRGAKAGQELKAEVIYPDDYAEPKLAGKTVAYEVTVKGIKKRILPELDGRVCQGDWQLRKSGGAGKANSGAPGEPEAAQRGRRDQRPAVRGDDGEVPVPGAGVAGAGAD